MIKWLHAPMEILPYCRILYYKVIDIKTLIGKWHLHREMTLSWPFAEELNLIIMIISNSCGSVFKRC